MRGNRTSRNGVCHAVTNGVTDSVTNGVSNGLRAHARAGDGRPDPTRPDPTFFCGYGEWAGNWPYVRRAVAST